MLHARSRLRQACLQTICCSQQAPEHSRERQADQTCRAGWPTNCFCQGSSQRLRNRQRDECWRHWRQRLFKSTPKRSGETRSIKHAHSCPNIGSSLCEQTHYPQPSSVHRCLSPTAHHPPPSALTMSEAAPPTDARALSMEIHPPLSPSLQLTPYSQC
jgi:hypothetical protein